jgi:hypothetical protein
MCVKNMVTTGSYGSHVIFVVPGPMLNALAEDYTYDYVVSRKE